MTLQNDHHENYSGTSRRKVILRFVLTWLITIAIFIILFSRIKFVNVIAVIKQTDLKLLCAGVFFSIFAHVILSSARYQEIVRIMKCRLSFFEAVTIRMGCNPIKGILPFKMGELAILAYMKKKHHLSYPRGFVSLLVGYFFSFIALMIFYFFGAVLYSPARHQKIFSVLILLLIFILITPWCLRNMMRLLVWCLKKYRKLPEEQTFFNEKYDYRIIRKIFFHSLGIEGSKLFIIFILLKSLRIEIPLDALLLFGSTTILAVYLPVTYWGLGIRESAILLLFSAYATPDKLLAGSLLITFVDSLLPVLLGLFFIKPFLDNLWENKKTEIMLPDA